MLFHPLFTNDGVNVLMNNLVNKDYLLKVKSFNECSRPCYSSMLPNNLRAQYLFIIKDCGQYFVYLLWVKRVSIVSCVFSCHTGSARMYASRQYHEHVCLPKRKELQKTNHPRHVIGSHSVISVNLLLVQPI
jgi:hypothetical protein